jgi:hypothetical protein
MSIRRTSDKTNNHNSDKTNNHNSIVKEAATAATTGISSTPWEEFLPNDSSSKISHTALPSATKSKTKTTKKASYVSKLPEHLFLHLKRFEFSYTAMRQVRICIVVVASAYDASYVCFVLFIRSFVTFFPLFFC